MILLNEKLQGQIGKVFDNARRVNYIISEQYGIHEDMFVPLQYIFDAVKELTGYYEILIYKRSLSKFLNIENMGIDCNTTTPGAMLSTRTSDGRKIAEIDLNIDMDANMQRFSAVHELGHLINELPNFSYETADDGKSTISAHINQDITWLDDDAIGDQDYLVFEQMANIFALLVLIRRDIKIKDIMNGASKDLATRYGVTEDAVFSRVILSAMRKS